MMLDAKELSFCYKLPETPDWKQRLFQHTGKSYDEFIIQEVKLNHDPKDNVWTCTVVYLDR